MTKQQLWRVLWRGFLLSLVVVLPLKTSALEGKVRVSFAEDGSVWVGQKVAIRLDFMSTGFSFSEQRLQIPAVPGAVLLQADNSANKLSEEIDGETWQILRYELLLFAQRPGVISVPPIAVSFNSSAGYGTEPATFEFQTENLQIEARLPPGLTAQDAINLIVSPEFKLNTNWQPDVPAESDKLLSLKVGDALGLTVTRQAKDIASMAFTPLDFAKIDGLARYPAEPMTEDSANRGVITAKRIDSVTYIGERAGNYTIPEYVFSWWNPDDEQLQQKTIPAVRLTIVPNPAFSESLEEFPGVTTEMGFTEQSIKPKDWLIILFGFVSLALIGAWFYYQQRKTLRAVVKQKTEADYFRDLVMFSKAGEPRKIYNALMRWLDCYRAGARPVTLTELLKTYPDPELQRELTDLQQATINGSPPWSSSELINRLSRMRTQLGKQTTANTMAGRRVHLQALNPDT